MPVCSLCENTFSTPGNLYRHMRGTHNVSPNPVSAYDFDSHACKCLEGCNISFINLSHLRKHLNSVHSIEFEEETYMFDNLEDFNLWLEYISNKEVARYVKRRLVKKGKDYYYCSRSGKSQILGPEENRKRKSRKGTSKINAYCTSVITVSYDNVAKKYMANFVKTHYGHTKDLKHLRLLKKDRLAIAKKLNSGFSTTAIVKEHKAKKKLTDDLKRCDVITGADVRNVRKTLITNGNDIGRLSTSSSSEWELDHFLEQAQNNNQLLDYKKYDGRRHPELEMEDFCVIFMTHTQEHLLKMYGKKLICIDSCFGVNRYKIDLTVITIFDDLGVEIPVAFMFTNRRDLFINDYFIRKIKEKIGYRIKTNVLLSSVNSMAYKSWKSFMEPPKFQLFSPWHVSDTWKRNLQKIPLKEKASEIYTNLEMLLASATETEFHFMLEELMESMAKDEQMQEFHLYFNKFFYSHVEKWAKYSYERCGLSPELQLELLHEPINSYLDDDKKPKPLLTGIKDLLSYSKPKIVDSIAKSPIDKQSDYLKEIEEIHGLTIDNSYMIECYGDKFLVNYESDDTIRHVVIKVQPQVCCTLVCDVCRICVHQFRCSCLDFILNATICEHIHCVVPVCSIEETPKEMLMEDEESEEESEVKMGENDENEIDNFAETDDTVLMVEELKEKCGEILDKIDNVQDENVLIQCLKYLNKANNLLDAKQETECNDATDASDSPINECGMIIIEGSSNDHNYCNQS